MTNSSTSDQDYWKEHSDSAGNYLEWVSPQPPHVCPHCGRCPTCGKPYYREPYPYYPSIPWIVYC